MVQNSAAECVCMYYDIYDTCSAHRRKDVLKARNKDINDDKVISVPGVQIYSGFIICLAASSIGYQWSGWAGFNVVDGILLLLLL